MNKYSLIIAVALLAGCSSRPVIRDDIKKEIVEIDNVTATQTEESVAPENNVPVTVKEPTPVVIAKFYRVTKVVDGDTIDVLMDGKTERVRLLGINTPESVDPRRPVECFGREASAKAKEWLDGRSVRLEYDESQDRRDKYGRLLAYVYRDDGFFYNLEIIKAGYAYEYTYFLPYEFQAEFKAAQKDAETKERGLWAPAACASAITKIQAASSTAGGCLIKGNINSKKEKIYHLPGCTYYKNTIIDEANGEKWFCTEAEAVAAGWRKAGNCPD